jgi:ATP phosphoribosyltransferase
MARAQELPYFVAQGLLDAAITGMDMIEEAGVSLRDVCDLGYNKLGLGPVALALAVPQSLMIRSLNDLEGKRVATAYPNLTQLYFNGKDVSIQIIPSLGATEGKVPFIADAIVELVETGNTLKSNKLKPVFKLFETTVHLVSSNATWGYTWKRRNLEIIVEKLRNAARRLPKNTKMPIEIPGVIDLLRGN